MHKCRIQASHVTYPYPKYSQFKVSDTTHRGNMQYNLLSENSLTWLTDVLTRSVFDAKFPRHTSQINGGSKPITPSAQGIGKLSRRPITFDRRIQLRIDHTNLCYIIILFIYLFIRSPPRKNKGRLTYLPDKLR